MKPTPEASKEIMRRRVLLLETRHAERLDPKLAAFARANFNEKREKAIAVLQKQRTGGL